MHVATDPSARLTAGVARLRAGYVVRRPGPLDGRAGPISLSDAGVDAVLRVRGLRGRWARPARAQWIEEARRSGDLLERPADDPERTGRRSPSLPAPSPVAG